MKHAEIAVLAVDGALVWSGSLYRFAKDNEMGRAEVADLIEALLRDHNGRPEPAIIGGGATPTFFVSLVG